MVLKAFQKPARTVFKNLNFYDIRTPYSFVLENIDLSAYITWIWDEINWKP